METKTNPQEIFAFIHESIINAITDLYDDPDDDAKEEYWKLQRICTVFNLSFTTIVNYHTTPFERERMNAIVFTLPERMDEYYGDES